MLDPSLPPPATEPALEPDLPIIDTHHHLWDIPPVPAFAVYDPPVLAADIAASGHAIIGTVYVDARSHYRTGGPEALRPVGETEWVEAVAGPGTCQAMVAHADLRLGAAVGEVLDAHAAASPRFRGVRHMTAFDADLPPVYGATQAALMPQPEFRKGVAALAARGLSFDAWVMQHQIGEVTDLARAVPQASIVLDHLGGPMALGRYAGRRTEAFAAWRAGMAVLATCPNVTVKLGALNMGLSGLGAADAPRIEGSEAIAARQADVILTAIDLFGPDRCMVESNFPIDRGGISYATLWNVFKRVTTGFSAGERAMLFSETARRVYRMTT